MSPDEFIEHFLAGLIACNADDGEDCGLPGMNEMRIAVQTAWKAFQKNSLPSMSSFLPFLQVECLGEPDLPQAPLRPSPPPFAKFSNSSLKLQELSTVVSLSTFLRLIHDDDKASLEEEEGLTLAVTGSSDGEAWLLDIAEMLSSRLPRLSEERRRFRLAEDESHGRPYLWFTAREDLQHRLSGIAPGRTHADIARDSLGLIHHTPNAYRSRRSNNLVALHFPAAVAERAGHLRPSSLQAFDNRRFILRFDPSRLTTAEDWGTTIDLHTFLTREGVMPVGCRERLLLRLQASLFEPEERLTFEYLGAVTSTRGEIQRTDGDDVFLKLVARDRSPSELVKEMCND